MRADELWHSRSAEALVARLALMPISALYALGWEIYLSVYQSGLKRTKSPHPQIVCVGNLQSGGTGKSPVARSVARMLRDRGRDVVVSCSGHGSPHSAQAAMAPVGPLSARAWGDEAAMMRWLEPELPLVVGRDRVLAAKIADRHYPGSVLVMDDGFQHLPLKKHATILLDPPDPDNRLWLPAGPYREPRWNRKRADTVLPGEFHIETENPRLVTPDGSVAEPSEYAVLCALGRPDRFLDTLERAFPDRTQVLARALPDHDPLDAGTLLQEFSGGIPIVVTAKDWVKLRERADVSHHTFLIATHNVRIEPIQEFISWLERKLNEAS